MNNSQLEPSLKVATFPESWRKLPFLDMLEAQLASLGVEFQTVGSDYLSTRWLLQHRESIQVLHFHWLQYHYERCNALASWFSLLKLSFQLMLAKLCGYRIVWTMHNLLPHDRKFKYLDLVGYSIFAHLADSIVTLCKNASFLLGEKYKRHEKVFIGYHGHYMNYANEINQTKARELLEISTDRKVFLFFGQVRPYKGIEELIYSFKNLSDPDACLIIAGKAPRFGLPEADPFLTEVDERIMTVFSWIPDEEVQIYFNACDFVVLPFVDVMTSGSALMALGFSKPVIAPAIGCLPEIITADTGLLYDRTQSDSLAEALCRCYTLNSVEMGMRALQSVSQYTWENLAQITMQAYVA